MMDSMVLTQIDRDADRILTILADAPRGEYIDRNEVGRLSRLAPERVNDAVARLVDSGYADWVRTLGTSPYDFNSVRITSRGRYENQRLIASKEVVEEVMHVDHASPGIGMMIAPILPPSPIGSPYGFTDEDWRAVSERKVKSDTLYAVLGHQFDSTHFDTAALRRNVENMLARAVDEYNNVPGRPTVSLDYRSLSAGYGEHLFNEIARDIIGSDIAIFETSDLNPNVMLEMGVALTWGVRVLPIKSEGRPKPPTDVSGQTWADYRDHAATFVDPNHHVKLLQMIERVIVKKGRST